MGCGGSRPENRADVLPAKASPSSLEEELLKDGVSDGDNSSNHHSPRDNDRGSSSSQEDDVRVAPAPECDETTTGNVKIAEAVELKPELNKQSEQVLKGKPDEVTLPAGSINVISDEKTTQIKEVETPVAGSQGLASAAPYNNETSDKQDSKHGEDGEDKTLEAMDTAMKTVNEIEMGVDQNDQDSELEDEEEGRLRSMDESCICPGSPSFRVYFIESSTNTDDEDKDDDTDKKSSSDQESSEIIESVSSNELSGAIEKKKGKRGRRFRVIPKGKNLLNVKSCYYPSCSGGHDKARLLGQ
ncbi:hypothetical protein OIU79_029461 [Salix purpurea]|uniref:Uncharacterized protein n=1 Tax=Salix purpurea TaxID=77065 RepID=A0A9Q0VGD8_SALPP|nr:hypothetical protein OIU79_029461 [Salix purpurea]